MESTRMRCVGQLTSCAVLRKFESGWIHAQSSWEWPPQGQKVGTRPSESLAPGTQKCPWVARMNLWSSADDSLANTSILRKLGLGENIDLVRLLCTPDRIRIDMKGRRTVQRMNRVAGAVCDFLQWGGFNYSHSFSWGLGRQMHLLRTLESEEYVDVHCPQTKTVLKPTVHTDKQESQGSLP